jgi:hypothetical protein
MTGHTSLIHIGTQFIICIYYFYINIITLDRDFFLKIATNFLMFGLPTSGILKCI